MIFLPQIELQPCTIMVANAKKKKNKNSIAGTFY